jgi:peroxin-5
MHGGTWHDEFMAQPHMMNPAHSHPHQRHFDPMAAQWADEMHAMHGGNEVVAPTAAAPENASWLEQFENQETEEWVQDFTTDAVKDFGIEGEAPMSVDEKRAHSEFYSFLAKVNSGAIQFDEQNQIIDNPQATDFASEFLRQEMPRQEGRDNDEDYEQAWGSDDNNWMQDYVDSGGVPGQLDDAEKWMEEFQKLNQMGGVQDNGEYPFAENNPYLYHDQPFEEGLSLLRAGTLAAAALAFEAACQKDAYHVEAWQHLGTTQQENEKDPLAIIALKKAHELDPMNLPVYMALAVSFTNEAQHGNALQTLRDWLLHHPEFSGITPPLETEEDNEFLNDYFYVNPKHHKEVAAMYEIAVRQNPMDADVHIALGVIHNLSHEYDLAATDFEKALQIRPEDAKLWNKLGATLANGSRPREAINAYNRALDVVPGYVRAQYNMGISLSNLGEYADAVRQFLKALHMQQDGVVNEGDNGDPLRAKYTREIWDVMRMTFHLMDRNDLVELTLTNDIKPLAREFGLTLY